jgi:putative ABC transport system permease protein
MERAVIDRRVLAFAAVACLLSTVFFGLLPALQSASPEVTQTLHAGSRATGGLRVRRVRNILIGAEVAMAVLFLVVAMLFMRTLAALQRIEPGFDATNILTMRVSLPEARYATDAAVAAFYDRVVERLRASQDVITAGAGLRVPAAGSRYNPNRSVVIQGRTAAPGETQFAADLTVTPGYLETLRIPLRRGRALTPADGAVAPLAVVVSEMMVRRYWSGMPDAALGARIRLGDEPSADAWRPSPMRAWWRSSPRSRLSHASRRPAERRRWILWSRCDRSDSQFSSKLFCDNGATERRGSDWSPDRRLS